MYLLIVSFNQGYLSATILFLAFFGKKGGIQGCPVFSPQEMHLLIYLTQKGKKKL